MIEQSIREQKTILSNQTKTYLMIFPVMNYD